MISYFLFLVLGLFSAQLTAEEHSPEMPHNKRHMISNAVQNVNGLFDAMLLELDESHIMYHASCEKAQQREIELKNKLMSLQQENEHMCTIQAELTMAQKDLRTALESENMLKNKLTMLQQRAGKEISTMRNEFESFKAKLETKTNDIDKMFW